jgi:hypothetical protein
MLGMARIQMEQHGYLNVSGLHMDFIAKQKFNALTPKCMLKPTQAAGLFLALCV